MMTARAKSEPLPRLRIVPSVVVDVRGDPRTEAVRIFRDLADRIERGDLRGARVEWREGLGHVEAVELDERAGEVRFRRVAVTQGSEE